jgi:hypothetical protein
MIDDMSEAIRIIRNLSRCSAVNNGSIQSMIVREGRERRNIRITFPSERSSGLEAALRQHIRWSDIVEDEPSLGRCQ